tara:strand:- start:246 stop:923 length:678 start_codon:yes stop_codon:yes gene_type:complete
LYAKILHIINKNKKGLKMVYNKKGAMFGLDARIALAIFGALSVISGAALYSAIQDARVTATLADLEEVGKATTQYLLDTGSYPASLNSGSAVATGYLLTERLLTNNSVTGWNGPYLPYSDDSTANDAVILHSSGNNLIIAAMKTTGLWDAVTNTAAGGARCEQGDDSCAVFVCIEGLSNDLQLALEEKVDGPGAGNSDGRVRFDDPLDYTCLNVMVYDSSNSSLT